MAILVDREGEARLRKLVGKRIIHARTASGLKACEAAENIGHRNGTQIALAESGKRLPPLLSLIKLADLFGVSIDYLVGRIDDPLAEAMEVSEGTIVYAVKKQVADCFEVFSAAVAKNTINYVTSKREDLSDLQALIDEVNRINEAIVAFVDANPEFEDMPKGSRVKFTVETAGKHVLRIKERLDHENGQKEKQREARIAMVDGNYQRDLFVK